MRDDRIYPTRPIVGVGAVVWRHGKVLLVRRAKNPGTGTWSLPGGAQELGETIKETAIRETREETGVEIRELTFLGAFDSMERDEKDNLLYHFTLIDFEAFWVSGEPRPGDGETDAKFFAMEELTDLNLWEPMLNIILKSARRRA